MAQYAVLHSEKGTSNSGGIGKHIDRNSENKFSFKHADPDRTHLNKNYEITPHCKLPLSEAIENRISEGYNGKRKVRSDAVKFVTHVLSGSHEKMKEIEKDPDKLKSWVNENIDFISKEFGKENIVRFSLHLDEKTPHIHAVTVPLTEDGRLSAKETFGNRSDLRKRQTRYAEAMEKFGLNRGRQTSGVKHESAKEFYARIKQANEVAKEKKPLSEKANIFNKSKIIQQQNQQIQSLKTALFDSKKETEKKTEELDKTRDSDNKLRKQNKQNKHIQNNLAFVESERERFKKYQTKRIRAFLKRKASKGFRGYSLTEDERFKKLTQDLREWAKENKLPPNDVVKIVNKDGDCQKSISKITTHPHDRLDNDRSRGRGI